MKVAVFLVSFALFVGSFVVMGYAFAFDAWAAAAMFLGGILLASLAFVIPFHILERFE